jgi:hypothetical protein
MCCCVRVFWELTTERCSLSPVEAMSASAVQLMLGDAAPDFDVDAEQGPVRFSAWLGTSWG